jgi:hypothetical protein
VLGRFYRYFCVLGGVSGAYKRGEVGRDIEREHTLNGETNCCS